MFKPMSALMWTVNRFNNSILPISWSSPMPIATYLNSYLSAPFWTDVDSMRPRQRLCFMMQIQSWCFKAHWKRRMVLMPWRPRVGWHGNARAMHWQCSAWEVVVAWKPKCPAFQIGTLFTNFVGQPCPVAQNFSHSPRLSRHWFQKAGTIGTTMCRICLNLASFLSQTWPTSLAPSLNVMFLCGCALAWLWYFRVSTTQLTWALWGDRWEDELSCNLPADGDALATWRAGGLPHNCFPNKLK